MKRTADLTTAFGAPPERREQIAPTVLAFSLIVGAGLVAITPINDFLFQGTYIAGNHFPIGAFAVVLFLTLVANVALRKLTPRLALSPAQLIAVWVLITVPSGIPSSGLMRYFVPTQVAYHYYASPENRWDELLGKQIPSGLLLGDERAAITFFEGLGPGDAIPWGAWLGPSAIWGIYAFAVFAMMIGLSVLLRRRWVEQERFTFPLVQVPMEVATQPEPGRLVNSFLRNRQVWLAVGILLVVHTLRGLHQFYPNIPQIRTGWIAIFPDLPLAHGGPIWFNIYPLVIGFAYLLTSEVGFSLWFLYLFYKARAVVVGMLGVPMAGTGAGYGRYLWASLEESGGTIALAVWFVWVARSHLTNVFRKAFTDAPAVEDSDEPLSYRVSVWLFLVGVLVMVGWLYYFGGSLALALINVVIGIAVFITLAWMVTQGGLIFLQPTFSTTEMVAALTGSRSWPVRGLLVNLWNESIYRMDLREYLLPSLLNAFKLSDAVDLHRGSLVKGVSTAIALTFFVSLMASIWLPYARGGAVALPNTWTYLYAPQLHFKCVAGWAVSSLEPSIRSVGHFTGGFLLIMATMWLRATASWFTLHPIGFIIGSGYPIRTIWFPIFIGWLVKGAIMRWGGFKAYRDLRPFFLGLIIGDCIAGAIWIIVGFITTKGYMLLPG